MAACLGVPSGPVRISLTPLAPALGRSGAALTARHANVQAKTSTASRWSLAGQVSGKSAVPLTVLRRELARLGPWKSVSDFCREVPFGEEGCGVGFPPGAQMVAGLNPVGLSLMDWHQVPHVARQLRRFASPPHEALDWVLDF
jgi:hypothetical protein